MTIATPSHTLAMRRATQADAAAVGEIMAEAGQWLLQRGIRQWPGYPEPDLIQRRLEHAEIYMAELGGAAVGTLTLQQEDPEIWGELPPDALYVHGLAIRRSAGGRGLGGRMLAWAADQAARRGRAFLRLDCMGQNTALCSYYERNGFAPCGVVQLGGWQCARYQRRAALPWPEAAQCT